MSNWVGKQHHSCSEIPGYIASQEKNNALPHQTKVANILLFVIQYQN